MTTVTESEWRVPRLLRNIHTLRINSILLGHEPLSCPCAHVLRRDISLDAIQG